MNHKDHYKVITASRASVAITYKRLLFVVMKKFYNQTCEDDSECAQWSDASLVCKNGLCDCAENFVLPAMTFGPIQRCEPGETTFIP